MTRAHLQLVPGPEDEIDAHVLSGQEHIIDEMVESHDLITTCQARIDERRTNIQQLAAICRARGERKGKFSPHVVVLGSRKNIKFTWANAFKDIGASSIPTVRKALGGFFTKFFEVKKKYEVDPDHIDELKELLGKRYKDLIIEKCWAEAVPDLRQRRFYLLHQMDKDTLQLLDEVIEQLAEKPRLFFR